MSSNVSPQTELLALLSAAGVTDGGAIGALQDVAGSSLIGWQISALQKCGIGTFLIEVDSVPGELLNLADGFRKTGARVEFVRSATDLQNFLKPAGKLIVLAEAHYFSASLLVELAQTATPFIATIDGRDENAAFERIDLNTRWAGFALLDAETARSLMELPEGWSIASSLLRHGIQRGVTFSPINQGKLQSGYLARISSQAGADALMTRMLSERIGGATGLVERHIFGPVAKIVAPHIWVSKTGASAIGLSKFICAAASFGCGAMGWGIAAAATALIAIFFHTLFGVIGGLTQAKQGRSHTLIFWGCLVAAGVAAAWSNTDYAPDAATFIVISIGLIITAYKLKLPRWSATLLQSPALLAAVMLFAAGLSAFALGTKIVTLGQLGLLVAGLYWPVAKGKNSNQA
jgi:hypothetical protein